MPKWMTMNSLSAAFLGDARLALEAFRGADQLARKPFL
jgi:hypothetical protein